jgi:alkylhydroperoxidase family enzyme
LAVAFISYLPQDQIPESDRVPDDDNIIQVHGVHSAVMRLHYDLYVEIMHRSSPLSRVQREMVAVAVSSINGCEY